MWCRKFNSDKNFFVFPLADKAALDYTDIFQVFAKIKVD